VRVPRHRYLDAAVAAVTATGVAASAASGAAPAKRHGVLSSRLATVSQRSFAKVATRAQARDLSLPAYGPGSLLRDGSAYVVDVRVAHRTGLAAERLRRTAGVRVLGRTSRYDTVTVAARAGALRRIARQGGVEAVTEELTPIVAGTGTNAIACQGSVTSEGYFQLHANVVNNKLRDRGAGVKVGVLSDSFDRNPAAPTRASGDVASGDLPGPGNPCGHGTGVQVLDDSFPGEDEGRGMLQIVHDLAPSADLAFATAFTGEDNFAANLRGLAAAGAKVIADDVSYFDEPFFQDGPVSVAVNDVTRAGVTYFSAAGNNNLIDAAGRNIASWETPSYRDGGACPAPALAGAADCLNFNPSGADDKTFGITVGPGATLTVDMQYAEPWFGVSDDLDLYLLDSANSVVLASSQDFNLTTQKPFELLAFTNPTASSLNLNLAIDRFSGAGFPRTKFALLENGSGVSETEYPSSSAGDVVGPTIFGHNGTAGATSIAAVPFDNAATIESFSSRGPVTHYFAPVNGTTPAAAIAPQVLNKPDVSATDCGRTTFFVPTVTLGIYRFCGSSAAAPHAAAVAALELSQHRAASVGELNAAQIGTAAPVDSFGADAAGTGLINAVKAVRAIDTAGPKARITKHPKRRTRKRKAKFKFRARGASKLQCKLDHRPFRKCRSPKKLKVRPGKHDFKVRALDNLGNEGKVAKFKWKVRKR
jgi:hypothetical protein